MCFQQNTTLACPGCGYQYPSVDVPIHCPESLIDSRPGFGTCVGGVQQSVQGPEQRPSGLPPGAADAATYNRSQTRVRNLFAELRNRPEEACTQYNYAIREYALTCLYNPHELLEGAFDALATTRPGWEVGHAAEIIGTPCVGWDYSIKLETLGRAILEHSCDRVTGRPNIA